MAQEAYCLPCGTVIAEMIDVVVFAIRFSRFVANIRSAAINNFMLSSVFLWLGAHSVAKVSAVHPSELSENTLARRDN